ncbi:MAG TPA: D-aminoacylase [Dissulfurispiraceae bacterium]|nr:D-aminoacylase [Dissulfurispiraceae bacterium]
MLDYLIKDGDVIDGSGSAPVTLNVGIEGDRIRYVGRAHKDARHVIDAGGFAVSPGFIDTHAHSEFTILADGRAEGKLSQAVTTEINGNCGLSAAPLLAEAFERREADRREVGIHESWNTFDEYFNLISRNGIAVNYATLCGHGNLRASVVGYGDGPPSESEMAEMKKLLADALRAGAKGLSTGLIYPPGVYSTSDEIIELAKVAAVERPGALYASHMRSEGDALEESIEETLRIGAAAGLPVHVSHIKTSGERNWHKIDSVIGMIEKARAEGFQVTCDRYPYIASSTDLDTVFPSWVYVGGVREELKRLKDPETWAKIRSELGGCTDEYWKGIYISSVSATGNKWMEGENVFDIAARMHLHPADAVLNITLAEEARAGAIFFSMCEENLRRFLSLSYTMIGSDSSVRSFSGPTCAGKPHPRGFGSFARFIGKYARDEGVVTLPDAVRRLTSLPAAIFGIGQRGLIKEGYYADIAVFNYQTMEDTATFKDPYKVARGVEHVFVNGRLAFSGGSFSRERAGRVLR